MDPTRTQVSRDQNGADRLERWVAKPLTQNRIGINGKADAFSILGARELFSKLPTVASPTSLGLYVLPIHVTLAQITGAGDVLTDYTVGHAFKILTVDAVVDKVVTTGSKAASLNVEIGSTNVTGGVVALTSANCTPLGAKVAGSAVTAANTGTATDTISIEAASVTAFVEGEIILLIGIQNTEISSAFDAAQGLLGVVAGTGTEVIARSTTGGINFKTQASTPADGDNVYFAPVTNSGLRAPMTAASGITFSTQVAIGSTALATMFASFGLNENPTDVDPTGTAGDGAMFVYDPTAEFITGATTAQKLCWALAHKVNGADTFTFTTIPVIAGVDYALEIKIGDDLIADYYINDVLAGSSPALTSGDSVSAFVGAELTATPAGQADFDCRFIQVGRQVG